MGVVFSFFFVSLGAMLSPRNVKRGMPLSILVNSPLGDNETFSFGTTFQA